MTASPVNTEAQTDTGDLKRGGAGDAETRKPQSRDAQVSRPELFPEFARCDFSFLSCGFSIPCEFVGSFRYERVFIMDGKRYEKKKREKSNRKNKKMSLR